GGALLLMVISFLAVLKPLDETPYQQTTYYQQTMNTLVQAAKQPLAQPGDSMEAGWGKASLIPPFATPLAGYGMREGALAEGVGDSLWVKAFFLDNGTTTAAILAFDLLIVPPLLVEKMAARQEELPLTAAQCYLTATHTHASLGGFAPGRTGESFAGPYDEKVIDWLFEQGKKALVQAQARQQQVAVSYVMSHDADLVYNRLVGEKGTEDPWLRGIRFQPDSGAAAYFLTFGAHATCLPGEFMQYHGDYPGSLVSNMEARADIELAAFAAAGVGSMGPEGEDKTDAEQVQWLGEGLAQKVVELEREGMTATYPHQLGIARYPIDLGEPQVRIFKQWRLRPWVFESLFGKPAFYLSVLQLGDIKMIGLPAELSGELSVGLSSPMEQVILTSFNGGYAGYITDDRWYDMESYETWTMNWFGPGNGAYFREMIQGAKRLK
ncbi:MAG: hypothetical protein AAFP92_29575, partial [Bacteroidota bacterium]